MLVGMPQKKGEKSVVQGREGTIVGMVLAPGRRNGFSGIRGDRDTFSILMKGKTYPMSTDMVGWKIWWRG